MTTQTHIVPEIEPPIGTVATFSGTYGSGGGYGGAFRLRTEHGWVRDFHDRYPLSWAELTDIDIRNAQSNNVVIVAIQVRVVARPLIEEVAPA